MLIGLISFVSSLQGQTLQPKDNQHHIFETGAGFDHSLIALHMGYAYYKPKLRSAVFTRFTQSSALLASGNFSTRFGLKHWLSLHEHWIIQWKLAFIYAQSINPAGKYKALGYQVDIGPQFLIQKGSFGIDFSFNPFFLTHIEHSVYWKDYLYEDAKDGWYRNTVRTFRLGGSVSRYINQSESFEVSLKGGYQTNGTYDKLVPGLYFNLYLNYRLP